MSISSAASSHLQGPPTDKNAACLQDEVKWKQGQRGCTTSNGKGRTTAAEEVLFVCYCRWDYLAHTSHAGHSQFAVAVELHSRLAEKEVNLVVVSILALITLWHRGHGNKVGVWSSRKQKYLSWKWLRFNLTIKVPWTHTHTAMYQHRFCFTCFHEYHSWVKSATYRTSI